MFSVLEKPLVRFSIFGAVSFISFLLAVVIAFPDAEVKKIIEVQMEKQLGPKYEVKINDLDIWWIGLSASNVTIKERTNPNEPPPPEDEPVDLPLKVTLPEVGARLGIIRSIINLGAAVEFEADVGGGIIDGYYVIGSDSQKAYIELDEIDLKDTHALPGITGVPFFGTLSGEIELEIDPKKKAPKSGYVKLKGNQLTLGPATVKTDKFPPMTYFEVPQTNFGKLVMNFDIEQKGSGSPKVVAQKVESSGRDIRMEMWGYVELAAKFNRSRSNMNMRLQLDEGFVKKNSLGPLLNVNEVRKGKLRDWYGFTFLGSIAKIRFKGSTAAAKGAATAPVKDDSGDSKAADAKDTKAPAKAAPKKAPAKK